VGEEAGNAVSLNIFIIFKVGRSILNSHRDNIKDVLMVCANKWLEDKDSVMEDLAPEMADAVFDALGISEAEQDMESGHFMHHAEQEPAPVMPSPALASVFSTLNLVQQIAVAESIINIAFEPYSKAHLVRKMFMDMFRECDGALEGALSADDCYEIFQSILKGSSDVTYKTLFELVANYDGGHEDFCLLPMTDEIKNSASVDEAMHKVIGLIMEGWKKEGDNEGDDEA
jgi:hypothetical protein